ncbi:MAG: hypothetical protein ACYTGL_28410 [Planctomycetota bacterium]
MKHAQPDTGDTLNASGAGRKPCAVIGAGSLTATLWNSDEPYRPCDFNLTRTDESTGVVTQRFHAADLRDIVRLAQLIAAEISRDQTFDPRIRDELSCLAGALEEVTPTGHQFDGIRCPTNGPAFRSIVVLLRSLWDESGVDFNAHPTNQHQYRVLVVLDAWLRGVEPVAGTVPVDLNPLDINDHFGVCPVCGRHDSYRNLHREQWFICHAHQIRWLAGENVLNTWRSESPEDWQQNIADIGSYRIVYPMRNPSITNADD